MMALMQREVSGVSLFFGLEDDADKERSEREQLGPQAK